MLISDHIACYKPHRFWCSPLCSTGCWYNLAIIESLWSGKEDCLTGRPRWRSLLKDSVKWGSGDAPNEEQVITAGWQRVECKPRRVVSLVVVESLSRVRLFRPPWTVARQAPLSIGFSRKEYWSGLPCPLPEDLPTPGITLASLLSPASGSRFFTTSTTGKPIFLNNGSLIGVRGRIPMRSLAQRRMLICG